MENIQISTTQNVDIDYQLASVGDRIVATIIDGVIKLSYGILLAFLFFQVFNMPTQWWMILFILPVVFYNLLSDLFLSGQTLGKMIMKIKVVQIDGGELNFGACFIRWIFRIIDLQLTYGLGALLTVIIGGKGQRIGDIAAKTTVLKINPKGSLNNTAYMELEEAYQPKYPEVAQLSESDLQTIKEVLMISEKDTSYSNIGAPHPLAIKTKEVVLKKMNIESKEPSKEFLTTILKDYNFYHK